VKNRDQGKYWCFKKNSIVHWINNGEDFNPASNLNMIGGIIGSTSVSAKWEKIGSPQNTMET
jgi:hypothetical protein